MSHPRILGIGTANPPVRLTQEQTFHAAGYQGERIRKIFLNSDIDYRHFYLEGPLNREESSDQLNRRYLRGAMKTGCHAILNCVNSAQTTVQDVGFLAVCICTGYVCPDVGSRLIAHMGFSNSVQRASITGLGCAGALPTLQRAVDFVRATPGRHALMLAVEICSACYYVDNTLETVVGNAICADGAALSVTAGPQQSHTRKLSTSRLSSIPSRSSSWTSTSRWQVANCAGSVDSAPGWANDRSRLQQLLQRHGLSRSRIRFWVVHPGGRKVIDNVQKHFAMADAQLRFSLAVLRNYGICHPRQSCLSWTKSCGAAIRDQAISG